MQSTTAPKDTDPHDVFAIESLLAGRKAPPRAHDPVSPAAVPPVHVAPEITVGAPAPKVDPAFRATAASDIQVANIRPDAIRVGNIIKTPRDRPTAQWVKRVIMALLGLSGAIAAAAWQHYGDQAKAMAAGWTPPFVLAALAPAASAEKPPVAEQPGISAVPAAAASQAAAQPAALAEQGAAPVATASAADSVQALQSMARDLSAMGQQVEELKASIAQLKASQAQLIREAAKVSEARATEPKPLEQNLRPRVTAVAAPPRKPKPTYYPPAQAAYVPPLPPVPAPVPVQPAPQPQAVTADDGEPVVRPPMPLR